MTKKRQLTERELTILERIDTARKQAGLSWAALARAVGRPESGSQWSGRLVMPREETIHRMATVLGVKVGWRLPGDDPGERAKAQTVTEQAALDALRTMSPAEQQAALAAILGISGSLTKK